VRKPLHFREFSTAGGKAKEIFVTNPDGSPSSELTAVLWPGETFWELFYLNDGVGGANEADAAFWVALWSQKK
jgi:hypothetical protein